MQADNPAMNPEVKELTAQTEQLLALSATYTVATAAQYTDAGEQLKSIKAAAKKLDTLRKSMTQPLDLAKKAIMDFFRAPEEKLARAESGIKRAMIAYSDEQDRIRREEQRKADEAAQRERERLAKQAAAAAAKGNETKADALEQRAATVVAPIIQREAPKVSGVNTREVWLFEVVDEAAVPRQFMSVDESKIRKVVGALKGDTVIGGVRVYSEKRIASGSM